MNREMCDRLHAVIMAGISPLDDQTASIAPGLYNRMRFDGSLIAAGTRINWGGVLKRAAVDLWDTEEISRTTTCRLISLYTCGRG